MRMFACRVSGTIGALTRVQCLSKSAVEAVEEKRERLFSLPNAQFHPVTLVSSLFTSTRKRLQTDNPRPNQSKDLQKASCMVDEESDEDIR